MTPAPEATVEPGRPAYLSLWLHRLGQVIRETRAAVMLLLILLNDPATARAVTNGDPAARTEILRAFRQLVGLAVQVGELEPAPGGAQAAVRTLRVAFEQLATAAGTFERSTGAVIDLDGLAAGSAALAEVNRLLESISSGDEPAAAPPPRARKQRKSSDGLPLQ